MGKRGKTISNRGQSTAWQSAALNSRWAMLFRDMLTQLALARFRWVNLPATCDERYLEMCLMYNGCATIAQPRKSNVWLSLQGVAEGVNMYGNPPKWRAVGDNGTSFSCDAANGVYIYDNMLRAPLANQIQLLSEDMADIVRTKQINRQHAKTPYIFKGPQQMAQQMLNIYKQVSGNEPAVLVTNGYDALDVDALNTGVTYLGNELQKDLLNSINLAYMIMGVSNLPFKTERQTADEIENYGEATNILRSNPLECRRKACEDFNLRFQPEKPLMCEWRDDFESESFNFQRNVRAMMGGDA